MTQRGKVACPLFPASGTSSAIENLANEAEQRAALGLQVVDLHFLLHARLDRLEIDFLALAPARLERHQAELVFALVGDLRARSRVGARRSASGRPIAQR